jgi:hypothetical protein
MLNSQGRRYSSRRPDFRYNWSILELVLLGDTSKLGVSWKAHYETNLFFVYSKFKMVRIG